jgi:hypothetical protein
MEMCPKDRMDQARRPLAMRQSMPGLSSMAGMERSHTLGGGARKRRNMHADALSG